MTIKEKEFMHYLWLDKEFDADFLMDNDCNEMLWILEHYANKKLYTLGEKEWNIIKELAKTNEIIQKVIMKASDVPKNIYLDCVPFCKEIYLKREDLTIDELKEVLSYIPSEKIEEMCKSFSISNHCIEMMQCFTDEELKKYHYEPLSVINVNTKDFGLIVNQYENIYGDNDDIRTAIVNNTSINYKDRLYAFNNGCNMSKIRAFTESIAKIIYESTMQTICETNESIEDIREAKCLLKKVFQSNQLPVSCEKDFFERYRNLPFDVPPRDLVSEFMKNCKDEIVCKNLCMICDVATIDELAYNKNNHTAAYHYIIDKETNPTIKKLYFIEWMEKQKYPNYELINTIMEKNDKVLNKYILGRISHDNIYLKIRKNYYDSYKLYFDMIDQLRLSGSFSGNIKINAYIKLMIDIERELNEKENKKLPIDYVYSEINNSNIKKEISIKQIQKKEYNHVTETIKKLKKTYEKNSIEMNILNQMLEKINEIYQEELSFSKYNYLYKQHDLEKIDVFKLSKMKNSALKEIVTDINKSNNIKELQKLCLDIRESTIQLVSDYTSPFFLLAVKKMTILHSGIEARIMELQAKEKENTEVGGDTIER